MASPVSAPDLSPDKDVSRAVDLADVAVIIPCYRSGASIGGVVAAIPEDVGAIICVNDASPDDLGEVLEGIAASDRRVRVVTHAENGGVGAATITGYRAALETSARVLVKIDSDGQMNPIFIPNLVAPILAGEADYAKGNRFFDVDSVRAMPTIRLLGNAGLSFLTKLSSGYWNLFDPTNGYTALHADVARALPLDKIHPRYFFESDILFRLNTLRARIAELPMETVYGDETSHLSEMNAAVTFPLLHVRNTYKRIIYNYFLRGFSSASLSLATGLVFCLFGLLYGLVAWAESSATGVPATTGTVMLSVVPLLVGFQLLLSFLQYDVAMTPDRPIHANLAPLRMLQSGRSEQDRASGG
jgi:glycosyltransferase involved in cell wall biosynthesis